VIPSQPRCLLDSFQCDLQVRNLRIQPPKYFEISWRLSRTLPQCPRSWRVPLQDALLCRTFVQRTNRELGGLLGGIVSWADYFHRNGAWSEPVDHPRPSVVPGETENEEG